MADEEENAEEEAMQENPAVPVPGRPGSSRADRGVLLRLLCVALLFALPARVVTAREDEDPNSTGESESADSQPFEGLVAHMGSVTASFRFFGDVGAAYDSMRDEMEGAKANFLAGTFDFFSSVRFGDHFQVLSEIVAEFEEEDNEVGFEMERLWGQWSKSDAFYLKLGREHAPVSRWNNLYHHGRIFWPALTQPFLARFEDQGGPLPIHSSGLMMGGTVRTRAGALSYAAGILNGRGLEPTEVTNVRDHNDTKAWDAGGSYSPSWLPALVFGGNYRNDRIPSAIPDTDDTREEIVTLFGQFRARSWEVLAEAANIDHEPPAGEDFEHRSAYLQVNYSRERWGPYGRVDVRHMDEGDPFYEVANLDLDRWDGLLGVRFDLAEQVALKIEAGFARAEQRDAVGEVTKDDGTFAGLGLQWGF